MCMQGKVSKYISILVFISVVITGFSGFAYGSSYVLTLSEAKKLAVIHSPEIKKQEAVIDLAEVNKRDSWIAYEQARANYQNFGINSDTLKNAMENAKKGYDAAGYAYDDANVNLENLKLKVEYDTENTYLSLLNIENNIKNLEESYRLQKEMVKIESLKMALGLSTKTLLDQQIQKSMDLEKQLQNLYDSKKTLKWQLNRSIGRNPEDQLELAPVTFEAVKYDNQQFSEQKAEDTSLAIQQYNRIIEDKNKEIEQKRYNASDKVEKLTLEVKQTELFKNDTEYSIKLAIKNIHEKLYLAQKTLVDNRGKYDMAKHNYEIQLTQYELGVISKIAKENSLNALHQAQAAYEKAVYDYYLAARELALAEQGILLK
ncbi:TolC family protein [Thermanaerosceptrum fracticalcis]|nr:TolC family protein [Thermanaerosceptrum fracticalcis]